MATTKSSPLVSVIIPTKDREDLLVGCLENVFKSRYNNIETIVVDDASESNKTKEVCKNWGRQRLKYVRINNSMGAGNARNVGVSNSEGKYLCFLDDDCRYHENKISLQVELIESDCQVGMVYCGQKIRGSKTQARSVWPAGWIYKKEIIKSVTSGTPSFLVRRDIFENLNGFDISLASFQDWDLSLRISKNYKIDCVKEDLVYIEEHQKESISKNVRSRIDSYKKILSKNIIDLVGEDPEVFFSALSNFFYFCCKVESNTGSQRIAQSYLIKAMGLRIRPQTILKCIAKIFFLNRFNKRV